MQRLHVVGFTTDHQGLILSVRRGTKTGAYTVDVDSAFDEALSELLKERGAESSPRIPRAESQLSVREMQQRLRSGQSIRQVARAAGVDDEWVSRFAIPIQAEQTQVVRQTFDLVMTKQRLGASTQSLGTSVWWNLQDRSVQLDEEQWNDGWSAALLRDSRWVVKFEYEARKRKQLAEWEVDFKAGTLGPRNRLGSDLGYVETGRRRRPGPPVPTGGGLLSRPAPALKEPATAEPVVEEGEGAGAAATPTRRRAAAAKKATVKKRATTRAGAKRKAVGTKKGAAKKAVAKRPAAKKAAATKRVTAKKAAGTRKSAIGKRPAAKKAAAKKAAAKKTAAKKTAARKTVAKAASARPAATKAAASRAVPKKTAAKKTAPARVAKPTVAKNTTAGRAPAKKKPAKRPAKKRAAPATRVAPRGTSPARRVAVRSAPAPAAGDTALQPAIARPRIAAPRALPSGSDPSPNPPPDAAPRPVAAPPQPIEKKRRGFFRR